MRFVLGTLLGGIAIFMGGYVTHMLLPLSNYELQSLPNEYAAIGQLKTVAPSPGVYIFPGMDGVNQKDKAAMDAFNQRIKNLPHGLVIMSASPGIITPAKLGIQFLGDLLASAAAALLLTLLPFRGYFRRLFAVILMGVFAGFLVDVPLWNWYGYTAVYAAGDTIDHALRAFSGGLVLAAIIKAR